MKKYRAGKIKREHTVIEKVWPVLEQMATCDVIASIIPGPISPLHTNSFDITFQRMTESGLRLLAKNGSAVQEIYIVTAEKEKALRWLVAQGIVDARGAAPMVPARPTAVLQTRHRTVTLPSDLLCDVCGKRIAAGSRAALVGSRNFKYVHIRCVK